MHTTPIDTHQRTRTSAWRDGVTAMAPLVAAYAPFAIVIGSTAATLDDPLAGWAGSWLIYGGSAHLAAMHGLAEGTALLAVVTGLLVHTRLLVYGASMAPHWHHQPRWFRVLAPALLIEPTWALAERYGTGGRTADAHRHFYLGAALTLGVGWSGAMALGALGGDHLPDLGLDVAGSLCLIALVGPRLRDRAHRWSAMTGASAAVLTAGWPAGTGIVTAIVAGCVAGGLAGRAGR